MLASVLAWFLIQAAAPTDAPPLEQWYQEALQAMEADAWATAIEKLEDILAEDPSHMPTRFNLAIALDETGRTSEAIVRYREILEADPSVFEAYVNLGVLLHEQGESIEAIALLEEGAALRPDDPVPVLYRAEILDQLQRFGEAEQAYIEALERAPDLEAAHRRLGFVYHRTSRADQALASFNRAVELGSVDPAVFVALGDIASDRSQPAVARAHYERALGLAPEEEDIQLRLALALIELDRHEEAISFLEALPNGRPALAEAYYGSERYPDAARVYAELAAAEPENAYYWFSLGKSYFELSSHDAAIDALQRGLRLNPDRADAWGALAAIYSQREDWARAAEALERDVALRPGYAPSHFTLGVSLDHLGHLEQALVHYNKFIELDDGSDDARTFQVRRRIEALESQLD